MKIYNIYNIGGMDMYCRKCGKQIDYDAEICVECQENEELFTRTDESVVSESAPENEYVEQQSCAPEKEENGSRMFGFGLALAAVIVAQFATGFISGMFGSITEISESLAGEWLIVLLVLCPIAIGMSVFTLIAGIKSVKRYANCCNQGKVKPIPTLVLGIAAIVLSGLNFLILSIAPFTLIALLA